jgi:hypothetical protein
MRIQSLEDHALGTRGSSAGDVIGFRWRNVERLTTPLEVIFYDSDYPSWTRRPGELRRVYQVEVAR